MVDGPGAELVEDWLKSHGVAVRTNAKLAKIEDVKGRKRLKFASGTDLAADVVIMAHRHPDEPRVAQGLGRRRQAGRRRRRAPALAAFPTSTRAGDVAQGRDLISGQSAVHAIEPTAQEHGRIVGANMAGKDVRYRGSLIINIVEVCHLDAASFGAWDDAQAEAVSGLKKDRHAYRKLLFTGERLTGAIIIGRSKRHLDDQRRRHAEGLVQSGQPIGR